MANIHSFKLAAKLLSLAKLLVQAAPPLPVPVGKDLTLPRKSAKKITEIPKDFPIKKLEKQATPTGPSARPSSRGPVHLKDAADEYLELIEQQDPDKDLQRTFQDPARDLESGDSSMVGPTSRDLKREEREEKLLERPSSLEEIETLLPEDLGVSPSKSLHKEGGGVPSASELSNYLGQMLKIPVPADKLARLDMEDLLVLDKLVKNFIGVARGKLPMLPAVKTLAEEFTLPEFVKLMDKPDVSVQDFKSAVLVALRRMMGAAATASANSSLKNKIISYIVAAIELY